MALSVSLFALIIIGALVAGSFSAGKLEQQSGRNTLFTGQAREAAEAGLSHAMSTTAPATLESMVVGGAPLDLGSVTIVAGISAKSQVTRLAGSLFLIRSFGVRQNAAGVPLATRSVGVLVRLLPSAGIVDSAAGPQSGRALRALERGWAQLH